MLLTLVCLYLELLLKLLNFMAIDSTSDFENIKGLPCHLLKIS